MDEMDDLLKAKADQEGKLNSILQKLENLEISQKKTANDIKDLKPSYGYLQERPAWSWPNLRKDRWPWKPFKRNDIVIWGLWEDAEKEHNSLELFLAHNFFENHMRIKGIEEMRAHRTNVKERAADPWPIHVYLLRYTDKVKITKAAAKALKEKVFFESQTLFYFLSWACTSSLS